MTSDTGLDSEAEGAKMQRENTTLHTDTKRRGGIEPVQYPKNTYVYRHRVEHPRTSQKVYDKINTFVLYDHNGNTRTMQDIHTELSVPHQQQLNRNQESTIAMACYSSEEVHIGDTLLYNKINQSMFLKKDAIMRHLQSLIDNSNTPAMNAFFKRYEFQHVLTPGEVLTESDHEMHEHVVDEQTARDGATKLKGKLADMIGTPSEPSDYKSFLGACEHYMTMPTMPTSDALPDTLYRAQKILTVQAKLMAPQQYWFIPNIVSTTKDESVASGFLEISKASIQGEKQTLFSLLFITIDFCGLEQPERKCFCKRLDYSHMPDESEYIFFRTMFFVDEYRYSLNDNVYHITLKPIMRHPLQ